MDILLDISRTVARSRLPTPTGIDRVERAYIRWALGRGGRFLAAVDGRQYLMARDAVLALLKLIDRRGSRYALDLRGRMQIRRNRALREAQSLVRRKAMASSGPAGLAGMLQRHLPHGAPYFNVGHDNLNPGVIASVHKGGFHSAVMIHDTIPVDHPPYARHRSVGKFRVKLAGALAAGTLLANSRHTAARLEAHGAGHVTVAPLGIDAPMPTRPAPPRAFITLGTIEPRKNHLLLLRIWRRFWRERGEASPRLTIIGRRGWENAEVFRMLDTGPMMGRTVIEAGTPGDGDVAAHLASAHALLFASHAEGYGLPLAEASAAGVPVIASDLPALREVGGDVPDYLPPDDEAAWASAILDHASANSQRRAGQIERLRHWSAPNWDAHFRIVENALATIPVHAGGDR